MTLSLDHSIYDCCVVTNVVTTSPPYHPWYFHNVCPGHKRTICVLLVDLCTAMCPQTHSAGGIVCLKLFCLQIAKQWVTVIYIEVKREAGYSGDAQQEGMAHHFQDVKENSFMSTWQTLNPALLLTVRHYVSHAYDADTCALFDKNPLCVTAAVIACALTDV